MYSGPLFALAIEASIAALKDVVTHCFMLFFEQTFFSLKMLSGSK